jgi:hypothetical protein
MLQLATTAGVQEPTLLGSIHKYIKAGKLPTNWAGDKNAKLSDNHE